MKVFRSRLAGRLRVSSDFCEVGFEALVLSVSGAGIGVL